MNFKYALTTDIGRKRLQNQDSGIAAPEDGIFVVADGMGGHKGGEIASAMAVDVIPKVVRHLRTQAPAPASQVLTRAIAAANHEIYERSTVETSLRGMGTTTTALYFHDGTLTIGQVGDSRCYFFRPQASWQLTRDHSLVQEKLRAGLITREQAKTDRMKNVITRSVGYDRDVNVEIFEMKVQPGDVFLVCSDGLSGLVDDARMLEIVEKHLFQAQVQSPDPAPLAEPASAERQEPDSFGESFRPLEEAAAEVARDTTQVTRAPEIPPIRKATEELVAAANANGGDDNITAILVQITG